MNTKEIRVIIVDDSIEFLNSAIQFINSEANHNIRIQKTSKNGLEAIEDILALHPDIIIIDIDMPRMNGFEATEIIKNLIAPPKIIIVSIHDSSSYKLKAIKSGADAFLSKMDFGENIIGLINELCNENNTS